VQYIIQLFSRGYLTSNLICLEGQNTWKGTHKFLLLSRQYLTSTHIKRIEEMMICLEGIFSQIY